MQYEDRTNLTLSQRSYLGNLLTFAESFIPRRMSLNSASDDSLLDIVSTLFLAKFIRTSRAILLLLDQRFGEDAAMLSRSLFEVWYKIGLADEDPKKLVMLFRIQFGRSMINDITRYRVVHGAPLPDDFGYLDLQIQTEQDTMHLIENLAEIDSDLAGKVRNNKRELWPDRSMRKTVKRWFPEDSDWFYKVSYSIPSDHLHADIGVLTSYMEINENQVEPYTASRGGNGQGVATSLVGMLFGMLKFYNNRFSLRREEEIMKIEGEANVLFKQHWKR